MAQARGIRIHQDPVVESPVPGNLPTTHPDSFGPLPAIRVGGKHEKIRAGGQPSKRS